MQTPVETLNVVGTPAALGTPETPIPTATPVESEKVRLNLIEGCDLSYLDSRKTSDTYATEEPRKLVMRLYEIPKGSTVEDVISEIDDKANGREVVTDPNYLTRLTDSTIDPCARPSDSGGTGGGPFGEPGTFFSAAYDPNQMEEAFKNQWALGSEGINLPSNITLAGNEVRVGVFDTSPYRISFPFIKRVVEAFPSPLKITNWDAGGTTMISNHGLFVASLIHRIAPKSSIQLIRVLNDDGCGELWTLNKGLEDYKSRMSAWSGDLDEVVINMSLGIRLPVLEEDNDTGLEQDDPGMAENDSRPEEEAGDATPEADDEEKEDLETLKRLITEADQLGAIIIAAAGNDSYPTLEEPNRTAQDMEIPASYDNVYGVAATNKDGTLSCYSNKGNLAAPGGNGGRANERRPDGTTRMNPCAPRASTWNTDLRPCPDNDMANCEYGVIGLAQTQYGPQYVLWSGTSFATPLVSGLAALAYEERSHDQVKCIIEKGTNPLMGAMTLDLDNGVINISESLTSAVIAQCQTLFPSTGD
jgi:hypothetical protein